MVVIEGLVHRLVEVTVEDLVCLHARRRGGELVELLAKVLALLVGALGRGREGGELVVDLSEELVHLAKVERAVLVLIVLLEEAVQPAQMVRGLREALLDLLRDAAPFGKGDLHDFGVFALLVGERTQEVHEVIGDIVLHSGAVADGVDGAEGGAVEAEMCVGFEGVFVGLDGEAVGDAFAEVGLSCLCRVSWVSILSTMKRLR